MLTLTDNQSTDGPAPKGKPKKATRKPPAPSAPLKFTLGDSDAAIAQVNSALEHTQRRLDNLRDLIDRFDLDDDDDGPRAA
jgi:hypothetical protein